MRSLFLAVFKKSLLLYVFTVATVQAQSATRVFIPAPLTLTTAVNVALQNDPWLVGNQHSQRAVEYSSISAGTLPDPRMSVSFANLPADNFDFGQEAMTQFKVGVSQRLPRGDSRVLKKKQLHLTSRQFPYQREDRKAKVAVIVSRLWLDAFSAQESIVLIEKNRALFEQLADVAQASYSSAIGKTRQHDIVRAQLEMTRLEDRLTLLRQKQEMFQQRLNEWIGDSSVFMAENLTRGLNNQLPDIPLRIGVLHDLAGNYNRQVWQESLFLHPAIRALEQKIQAGSTAIDLAKQKYKPSWGINASYAYRDDDNMGNDRADLFTVGVSFDLPLFTAQRQDQQVNSAISTTEAIKTERLLLLRKLGASFETSRNQLDRLNQRKALYQSTLLPQVQEQAEASLTAYTNDDGDFSEVVRARIAELNARIDALNIDVERQKTIAQLNYFFVASDQEIVQQRGITYE